MTPCHACRRIHPADAIGIAWLAYVSGWPVLWAAAAMYAVGAVVAWADRWRA